VRFEPPDYPALARRRGVEGTVVLSLLVAVTGQVSEVRFVRRVAQDVGINEAAEAAARRARFHPATRGGVPAEAWYTLTIPFQL
jgi:protein TonB